MQLQNPATKCISTSPYGALHHLVVAQIRSGHTLLVENDFVSFSLTNTSGALKKPQLGRVLQRSRDQMVRK
jgi:hypothetical protein